MQQLFSGRKNTQCSGRKYHEEKRIPFFTCSEQEKHGRGKTGISITAVGKTEIQPQGVLDKSGLFIGETHPIDDHKRCKPFCNLFLLRGKVLFDPGKNLLHVFFCRDYPCGFPAGAHPC